MENKNMETYAESEIYNSSKIKSKLNHQSIKVEDDAKPVHKEDEVVPEGK